MNQKNRSNHDKNRINNGLWWFITTKFSYLCISWTRFTSDYRRLAFDQLHRFQTVMFCMETAQPSRLQSWLGEIQWYCQYHIGILCASNGHRTGANYVISIEYCSELLTKIFKNWEVLAEFTEIGKLELSVLFRFARNSLLFEFFLSNFELSFTIWWPVETHQMSKSLNLP